MHSKADTNLQKTALACIFMLAPFHYACMANMLQINTASHVAYLYHTPIMLHPTGIGLSQSSMFLISQVSNVFAGKHGFITPRDLFKWAGRGAAGYPELAENGYLLLGERLRTPEDRAIVRQVLEKQMKVQLDLEGLYDREGSAPLQHLQAALTDEKKKASAHASGDSLTGVVWTPSMRRMYTLLDR